MRIVGVYVAFFHAAACILLFFRNNCKCTMGKSENKMRSERIPPHSLSQPETEYEPYSGFPWPIIGCCWMEHPMEWAVEHEGHPRSLL